MTKFFIKNLDTRATVGGGQGKKITQVSQNHEVGEGGPWFYFKNYVFNTHPALV